MTILAPSFQTAIPDARYARGVTAGSLAELIGLGSRGVRWRQVLVIVIGIWLTDTASSGGLFVGLGVLEQAVRPVMFVAAAITAIRSFQGGLAVALFTGAAYSALNTAIVVASSSGTPIYGGPENWLLRVAISSFAWAALTMLALAYAVAGRSRWLRMAAALFIAGIAQRVVFVIVYDLGMDIDQMFFAIASDLVRRLVVVVGWTATFWLGLKSVRGTP